MRIEVIVPVGRKTVPSISQCRLEGRLSGPSAGSLKFLKKSHRASLQRDRERGDGDTAIILERIARERDRAVPHGGVDHIARLCSLHQVRKLVGDVVRVFAGDQIIALVRRKAGIVKKAQCCHFVLSAT